MADDTDGPNLVEALLHWRWEGYFTDELNVLYHLSPEWRKRVSELWEQYEDLERRQRMLFMPWFKWQDPTDYLREMDLRDAATPVYQTLTESHYPAIPLGIHLNIHLNRADPDSDRRLYPWGSALADWQQIRALYRENAEYARSLSASQERSLLLLDEWWTCSYSDSEAMEAVLAFLEEMKDEEDTDDPVVHLDDFAAETMTNSSLYHATCFELFIYELHPRAWRPYHGGQTIEVLQAMRISASEAALHQRLAFAVLKPGAAVDIRAKPYPRRIDRRPDLLLRNDDRARITRKPYYLWDSKERVTLEVNTLPECPEYVCISHTWGRWRTRTSTPIPGVPWLVPENTLHDVRDLPDRLVDLNFRYIWLDLFCIPQDRGDRSKEEIANQASIFKGSRHCIAWLHDITSWNGTAAALDWLALQHMQTTCKTLPDDMEVRMSAAAEAATAPAELWEREKWAYVNNGDLYKAYGEPCSWFSSLWTLQELTLCPDMELYSRGWQRLEDRRGAGIPLRCLALFVDHTSRCLGKAPPEDQPFSSPNRWWVKMTANKRDLFTSLRGPHVPIGALDLIDVFSVTNLANVLRFSLSMDVLMTANLRQCSSKNRAPAIMSALGVTEWYTQSIRSGDREEERPELVFDMYPLGFLAETAQKLGALFWDTGSDLPREGPVTDIESMRQASMLPVSQKPGFLGRVLSTPSQGFIYYDDHPSVATWQINGNGSVSIGLAAVIVRTGVAPSEEKMRGRIVCSDEDFNEVFADDHGKVDDLRGALEDLVVSRDRPILGVMLYKVGSDLHGILLEELARKGSKTYLIKIGWFRAYEAAVPEADEVDWEVI
jgi:heterokaryon incompatibility protein (HET)